ncbi:hypothetical protein [Proteus columbae]|uniref:hypothetical protein n=1 Tax=Proteus columbae TaxID=1987580 RepID=UPI0012FFE734|nr:hypothetical protein [Proteus columbae]
MARKTKPLTDTEIKAAKPQDRFFRRCYFIYVHCLPHWIITGKARLTDGKMANVIPPK